MRRLFGLLVVAVVGVGFVPTSASAAPAEIDTSALREAVTLDGVHRHALALQRIADMNDKNRASGLPGYDASAQYVKQKLTEAGYQVTEQSFTFPFYRELAPSSVTQVSPNSATYESMTMDFSTSGDVTGRVVPTNDIQVPPGDTPNSSSSGCEAGDFPPAGAEPRIALIQRGTCGYAQKAQNARDAGYDAAIIFNEGQEGRQDLVGGTMFGPQGLPVVLLSHADGAAIYNAAQAGPVDMRVATSTEIRLDAVTSNIIAETPGGDSDHVLVVGAHLDSVASGPGINDNGSGVAAVLEIARQMALLGVTPRQKVRFAFWGAEEAGGLGSTHYVNSLSSGQLSTIFANLNFDMIGSPNFARFVFDGDGSDFGVPGPAGSGEIEEIFNSYFSEQNIAVAPREYEFRSDDVPFFEAGIPTGGVFTGSDGRKTAEEAERFGGDAGEPYDACYHKACDVIANLDNGVLDQLSDGAAHAIMTLALTDQFPFTTARSRPSAEGRPAGSRAS